MLRQCRLIRSQEKFNHLIYKNILIGKITEPNDIIFEGTKADYDNNCILLRNTNINTTHVLDMRLEETTKTSKKLRKKIYKDTKG